MVRDFGFRFGLSFGGFRVRRRSLGLRMCRVQGSGLPQTVSGTRDGTSQLLVWVDKNPCQKSVEGFLEFGDLGLGSGTRLQHCSSPSFSTALLLLLLGQGTTHYSPAFKP